MTSSGVNSYDDPHSLLLTWRNIALNSSRMHYAAQRAFGSRNRWLGGFATLVATMVGASVIKEIGGASTDARVRWGIGAIALLASVLTALHTFLGYAARTANHRSTAAGYATVVRLIDEELAFPERPPDDLRKTADSIRARLDALSQDAPEVPDRVLAEYRKPSVSVSSGTS